MNVQQVSVESHTKPDDVDHDSNDHVSHESYDWLHNGSPGG